MFKQKINKNQKLVFLDTETTDLKPGQIAQLSYLIINGKEGAARNFYFKVNEMSENAEKVHGLSMEKLEQLSNGKQFQDYANHILKDLENSLIICHNSNFDINYLDEEFRRCNINAWDTLKNNYCTMQRYTTILKIPGKFGNYKWPRLEETLNFIKIKKEDVIKLSRQLFQSEEVDFHDSRFDVIGCYLIYLHGLNHGHIK